MRGWLPAILDKRIRRMRSSKLRLQVVGQVKIIDGKDYYRQRIRGLAELFSKDGNLKQKRKIRHR